MKLFDSFLAIIPAREGSVGIPGKNFQKIGKKPMIQYTLEAASKTIVPKNIIVSTNDQEIVLICEDFGIDVPFIRPKSLSTDNAKVSDVVIHSVDWYKSKYKNIPSNILLLQPTSPFRNADDILSAIEIFNNSDKKTLVSACESIQHPWDHIFKDHDGIYKELNLIKNAHNRQNYPEAFYIDGGIYITDTAHFIETNNFIGDDPEVYFTNQLNAIDIDTPYDLEVARALFNARKKNEQS